MDDHAKRLLTDFARSREPSAERQSEAWAAISGRIAAGDPGHLPANDPASAGLSMSTKLGLALLTATAIAVGLLGLGRSSETSPERVGPIFDPAAVAIATPPPVEPSPPEPPQLSAAAPDPEPTPVADPSPKAKARPVKERPPRRRPTATETEPPATTPPASSLAEEMKLLRRASAQLRAERPGRALDTLAEHARRFPKGALAAEREIRRAEALCERGDAAASKKVVDAFLQAHPGTALRRKALSICAEDRGTP